MSTPDSSVPDVPQLPLLEEAAHDAAVEIKPTWRGWIHAATFPVA
ncbi:hemolysin III family protein, partial [Pseudomonas sp. BGM005]|nr:hemolysin III family protein [Pseudomonas sp. BG5]